MSFSLERLDSGELALRDLEDPSLAPLFVDFTSGALLHRLKGMGRNQPIGRALGLRAGEPAPSVIDATAGLGTDALVMAFLGCRVVAFERNATIFKLLEDGLARLRASGALPDVAARLSFVHGDARSMTESADVVYLDPMYPEEGRSKSALPKKTMQMFRRLLEGDLDAPLLFAAAERVARKRIVVKRPMGAPTITDARPAHSFEGKTARYDLYLTTSRSLGE